MNSYELPKFNPKRKNLQDFLVELWMDNGDEK